MRGGGGSLEKISSLREVWIISETTQLALKTEKSEIFMSLA